MTTITKNWQLVKKSAWSLAQLIYDTVNAPNFAECFSSMREYAKAINMDISSVTRKCKAVERKIYIEQNLTELPQLGVSQIIETAPIEDSKLEEFVSLNEITEKSTVKEVREAVKDFIGKAEEAEAEEAEAEAEAEEAEAKPKSMYIEYNDTSYEIFSPETINARVIGNSGQGMLVSVKGKCGTWVLCEKGYISEEGFYDNFAV